MGDIKKYAVRVWEWCEREQYEPYIYEFKSESLAKAFYDGKNANEDCPQIELFYFMENPKTGYRGDESIVDIKEA